MGLRCGVIPAQWWYHLGAMFSLIVRRVLMALVMLAAMAAPFASCSRSIDLGDQVDNAGARCGDGSCGDNESCANCQPDCGFCEGCGNGSCDKGETCGNCVKDCGVCQTCGNAMCDGGENCGSCPLDCGACSSCGNQICDKGFEDCSSCPLDCGLCPSCGDKTCQPTETCASCPQDCVGPGCDKCGDGFCKAPEDCLSCAPDCGVCPGCGDGKCQKPNEDCFTCPKDCGKCVGCGDGICKGGETCASCQQDCGVCSVCPNGTCESFEDCANCPDDCGKCKPITCLEIVACALSCPLDFNSVPPNFSLTCVSTCLAKGCANTKFFVDQVVNCAIANIGACGGMGMGGFAGCIQKKCSKQFASCISAHC